MSRLRLLSGRSNRVSPARVAATSLLDMVCCAWVVGVVRGRAGRKKAVHSECRRGERAKEQGVQQSAHAQDGVDTATRAPPPIAHGPAAAAAAGHGGQRQWQMGGLRAHILCWQRIPGSPGGGVLASLHQDRHERVLHISAGMVRAWV